MAITRDEVRQVAALARLRLTPEEEEALTRDLGHLLDAFETLQRLDTSAVEPMTCVDDFGTVMRADEVANPPADEALLANAPAREGRFFHVPRIIE